MAAGKIAARHELVTDEPDALQPAVPRTTSAHQPDRLVPETPAFAGFRVRVATALGVRAKDIAARWNTQSRTVALRDETSETGEDVASALVTSLASALASDGSTSDDLVALGLAFGVDAFEHGGSLHHALKALDLLSAMTLYAVELVVADEAEATAVDGVHVSRRLQQAASLLALAATKGYTQAMGDAMRSRFRHLRHDLRNPLGTIKSVLAMMDDETMPAEARTHPRFRAMAKRNAGSLGDLIADRLSDVEAVVPALLQQSASLRTVASGVRRDLRAEAESRSATVVVDGARVRVMVDAVGLELMLHELLLAALHEATAGDELSVGFGDGDGERATVTLRCKPDRSPVTNPLALERLGALASQMGAALETDTHIMTLLIPVRRVELTVTVPAAETASPKSAPTNSAQVPGTRATMSEACVSTSTESPAPSSASRPPS